MSFIEIENLQFADDRTNRLKSVLPAVRGSKANVLISGPVGCGKSYLARHLVGNFSAVSLDANSLAETFSFSDFFAKLNAPVVTLENVEKLSLNQQKALFETLESRTEDAKVRIVSTSRVSLKHTLHPCLSA
ncbi:MAG: AAA family ATPase, partial [Proteobacteria bacterium]